MSPEALTELREFIVGAVAEGVARGLASNVTPIRPDGPQVLTAAQAAEALGVSVRHVRNLVHRGDLRPFRNGGPLVIHRREIDRYLGHDIGGVA